MAATRNRRKLFSFILLGGLALTVLMPSLVVADVLIMPIRTVFSDRDRMKNITLVNSAPTYAKFALSFFHQKQNPDGTYTKQEEPLNPAGDISEMIVYSPREVNLPPNGRQAVRLSLRNSATLPDGEYRVHMRLKRIEEKRSRSDDEQEPKKGATTNIAINVGFAVPVIVRKGSNDATAKIKDVEYLPASADGKQPPRVSFKIERKGKFSTLGKIHLYTSRKGKKETLMSEANNVNIFAETAYRTFTMAIKEQDPSGLRLRIAYEGDDIDEGTTFDEETISIP